MKQYILIAEYSIKHIGFIIGTYPSKVKAQALIKLLFEELEIYSLYSTIDIPRGYLKKYQSYKITGEEYFTGCDRYMVKLISSNGDLSISVIRCNSKFDARAFIEYRNFFKYYGEVMN